MTVIDNRKVMEPMILKKQLLFLRIYFDKIVKNNENSLTVLEVGSGNSYNTNLFAEKFDNIKIIATDLQKFNPNYFQIEQLLSHEAVYKYGSEADILLMISPPCVGFMDYYAIKSYENVESKKEKYLIFVGEMGASDGSEGIYHYLIDGEIWNLVCRNLFHHGTYLFGGNIEKEVFLFKLA